MLNAQNFSSIGYGVPSRCFKLQFQIAIQHKLKSDMRNFTIEQRVGIKFHFETKRYVAYSKQGLQTDTESCSPAELLITIQCRSRYAKVMVSYLLSLTNVVFTWGLRITSRERPGFVKTRDRLTCKPLHGSDIVSVDYMANSKVLLYNKRRCVCVWGGSHSSSENRLELEILAIVLDDYEKCCSKYH